MLKRAAIVTILLALLTLTLSAVTVGWRMDGNGRYPAATPPTQWSTTEHVLWATALPQWSNSSPVLVGDRIIVCAEPSTVLCLDQTGKILWQKSCDYRDLPRASIPEDLRLPATQGDNGYSSDTPVCDGKFIYMSFGSGLVVCYNMDGERQWLRLPEKPAHPQGFGHSFSPVLVGDTLVVQMNDMFALDAKTGAERWRAKHKHDWGTPSPVHIGDYDVLITDGGDIVNVADGKTLATTGMPLDYGSPFVQDNVIYGAYGATAQAVQLACTDAGQMSTKPLWRTGVDEDRYYAAPLLVDGLLYLVNQKGVLSVLDAKSGEKVYSQRIAFGGIFYQTPVLAGNVIMISSENGRSLLFKPGRSYEEISRPILEPFRSTPVFEGKRMYIRTATRTSKLYCIGSE